MSQVFAALNACPLDKINVVIVEQDPYHGLGQGHGQAFSVAKGVRPPPSLQNIVKEAMVDVGIPEPVHGDLHCWARQGVLLLNNLLPLPVPSVATGRQEKRWDSPTKEPSKQYLSS